MASFTPSERTSIGDAILAMDPDRKIVRLDIESDEVAYSDDITQHERITSAKTDEELVRAFVITWLCTTGGYLPINLELEKRYTIGRPKGKAHGEGAELDILVKHADGQTYALIEVKAPDDYEKNADSYIEGQLFNIAPFETAASVLTYGTLKVDSSGPSIRAISISYSRELTFKSWMKSRVADTAIPINYGDATYKHFSRGGPRDLATTVTRAELERVRKRLHDVLWGGSKDDNLVYEYVVKLMMTKIFDELNTNMDEDYAFQIRYAGSTRETVDETFLRVNARYIEAYKRYIAETTTTRVEPLNPRQFSKQQITFVVELLQEISITQAGQKSGDLLGAFFEAITRDGFKQSKGLFFTHYNIAAFMLEVLQLNQLAVHKLVTSSHPNEALPYIIDPSCGSGTFLLAAMRSITQHVSSNKKALAKTAYLQSELESRFPGESPHRWAKDFIYGLEVREDLAISAKVNMVMHQDGHTHIFRADSLAPLSKFSDPRLKGAKCDPHCSYSKFVSGNFDVVITNPPFSITLDSVTQSSLNTTFELGDQKNSENLYLERWYQLLKAKGRLGAVLPESFFATAENLAARLFLFAHFHIRAIVSLPSHAFEPWTPTRTSLLFAQKKTPQEEAAWASAFDAAKEEADAAVRKARASLRALTQKRKKPMTADAISSKISDLILACKALDINVSPSLKSTDSEKLEKIDTAVKNTRIDVIAFRAASTQFNETWTAASATNIGYKRTKRAEYDRPNELFTATTNDDDANIVLNLNHNTESWRFLSSTEDILSALLSEELWA